MFDLNPCICELFTSIAYYQISASLIHSLVSKFSSFITLSVVINFCGSSLNAQIVALIFLSISLIFHISLYIHVIDQFTYLAFLQGQWVLILRDSIIRSGSHLFLIFYLYEDENYWYHYAYRTSLFPMVNF